jgi:hypothetical protein
MINPQQFQMFVEDSLQAYSPIVMGMVLLLPMVLYNPPQPIK